MNRKKAASSAAPKLYRSIREVSAELGVKPHVLRYWETQFPSLRPKKNRAGNRMYRPDEVKLLTRIKELLYAQRFTIEGARRLLMDEKKPRGEAKAVAAAAPAAATSAPPIAQHDRDRLEAELAETRRSLAASEKARAVSDKALAAARESLLDTKQALAVAEDSLTSSERSLAESKDALAEADDRDKTRVAALAVLRQELLLLARELRGEDEKPRVTVKAAEAENEASSEPEIEEEPVELPVGAIAVGA